MKSTEQFLLTLGAVQGGSNFLVCGVTIQMKATEQYFPMVHCTSFIALYKVASMFQPVDDILQLVIIQYES